MKPALDDGDVQIYHGDVIACLRELPDGIAQTCVTSPPYWGLRDYGVQGQIGLEQTPDEYVARMVDVFREVRRVLRDDGTLWLNLGDSYANGGARAPSNNSTLRGNGHNGGGPKIHAVHPVTRRALDIKPKDLVGIPWRVAFALQADGWYLRSDIIWHKPNPMPESVTDRPTKAHEYIFLLAKSQRYYYDAEAIREPFLDTHGPGNVETHVRNVGGRTDGYSISPGRGYMNNSGRNARSVWTITTQPYPEAHFAVFPPKLPELCIRAGSRQGDTILDPFMGSGTTAHIARHLGRRAIGTELNADYIKIARRRLQQLSLLGAVE